MLMHRLLLAAPVFALATIAPTAKADSITYTVGVNTSSQSGNMGYIELQLNSGTLSTADITATVTAFTGAALNSNDPNNDAVNTIGNLPGAVSFDNQSGNDYFEALTFGNSVSFNVLLAGPGVSGSGSSASQSGTVFEVSFFDAQISAPLFTTDPSGSAVQLDIAASGTVTPNTQPGSTATSSITPEPATLSLLTLGLGAIACARRRLRGPQTAACRQQR